MDIDRPTIDDFTSANHDHSDTANGGAIEGSSLSSTGATDGYVLTADGAGNSAWEASAGGGGGGNPYGADIVVATSGGDYTTLGAALAASSANDVIYVKAGTYTETALQTTAHKVTIIGEDRMSTLVDIGTYKFEFNGSGTQIRNMGFIVGGNANGYINPDCDDWLIDNCYFYDDHGLGNTVAVYGENIRGILTNNLFVSTGQVSYFLRISSNRALISNNQIYVGSGFSGRGLIHCTGGNSSITGNVIEATAGTLATIGIYTQSSSGVSGNTIRGCYQGIYVASLWNAIAGNSIYGGKYGIQIASADNVVDGNVITPDTATILYGVYVGASDCVVSNNRIRNVGSQAGVGIYVAPAMDYTIMSGNNINNFTTGIEINASTSDKSIVTSNILLNNTTALTDNGTSTTSANNVTV